MCPVIYPQLTPKHIHLRKKSKWPAFSLVSKMRQENAEYLVSETDRKDIRKKDRNFSVMAHGIVLAHNQHES